MTNTTPQHFGLSADLIENLFHARSVTYLVDNLGGLESIAEKLQVSLDAGLDGDKQDDIQRRIEQFGRNTYKGAPPASWFALFFKACQEFTVILLSVLSLISLAFGIYGDLSGRDPGGWIEGLAIIVAVFIVASVGATNDFMKDLQFQKLQAETSAEEEVRVYRNGREETIKLHDLVVGDIVSLHSGDSVPADGVFIPTGSEENASVKIAVDESMMTGEPHPKSKSLKDPFFFSGTLVRTGSGRMLVLAVGPSSEWGKLLASLQTEQEQTPLQEKLEGVVKTIAKIGVGVSVAVFLVLFAYWVDGFVVNKTKLVPCNNDTSIENSTLPLCPVLNSTSNTVRVDTEFEAFDLIVLLEQVIVSITIVVVSIPEGLPLAVTISLAYSMRLMTKDHSMVRHLSACETMGGATNICSDKTGTLTMNRMTIVKAYLYGKTYEVAVDAKDSLSDEQLNELIESCTVNIEDASLEKTEGQPIKFSGNITECALLVYAEKLGADYVKMQKLNPPVHKWAFTSDRKRMSTIIRVKTGEEKQKKKGKKDTVEIDSKDEYKLYCKGAAERVLTRCTHFVQKDSTVEKMDTKTLKFLNKFIEDKAKLGLRNICLAKRDFKKKGDWEKSEDGEGFEDRLTFIGIVSIEDPLRPEVPKAVADCQLAGITVRMVTGDFLLTAQKIARDCGILQDGGICLEGPNFEKMSDEELDKILPNLHVLARSTPHHKKRLVERLMHHREVVAVTGDGTNDAPALKAADVGLAMGIAGTKVAKEAADIIITDDNFASIVKGVMWGRCVFDNIRKFLQFQLTVNIVALGLCFIGAITRYGTPLNPVQLLWVNLIMDSLAALAMGTERPTEELLHRRPHGREGNIITKIMWRNIIGHAIFQLGVLCAILFPLNPDGTHMWLPNVTNGQGKALSVHYTVIFNTFVFLQTFNEMNSRKVTAGTKIDVFNNFFGNRIFLGILVFTMTMQAILVSFGGFAIKTISLTWDLWLICIGLGVLELGVGILLRFIPVPLEDWEISTYDENATSKGLPKATLDAVNEDDKQSEESASESSIDS